MPMQDQERRANMRRAGVTDKQLEESLGDFPVAEASARATGLADHHLQAASQGVRQLQQDAVIIFAKYNAVSRGADRDAREVTDDAELERDRAHLSELIADEYRLINPFGKLEGKQETINKALAGTIRADFFGNGGFEALETSLQVHGANEPHTVVLNGRFKMKGSGLAVERGGRGQHWRDLTGQYRTTHAFIFRDGRWQVVASQMTTTPAEPEFHFVGED